MIAARGQTMSIAFYPTMGLVSYGSEAAATKAPLVIVPAHHRARLELFFKRNDPPKISQVPSNSRTAALVPKRMCFLFLLFRGGGA